MTWPEERDERLRKIDEAILEIPDHTPERYEALGFYLMTLARAQWRMADQLRRSQREREARARRKR